MKREGGQRDQVSARPNISGTCTGPAAKLKDETRLVDSLDRKAALRNTGHGFETTQAADEICAHPVDWAGCHRRLCMERGRNRKRGRTGRLLSKRRARR